MSEKTAVPEATQDRRHSEGVHPVTIVIAAIASCVAIGVKACQSHEQEQKQPAAAADNAATSTTQR